MKIYKDISTGDETFSDTYKIKLVDDVLYEVYGKQGDIQIDGANPSAEEADENVKSGADVVLNYRLCETYAFGDNKSYTLYLMDYMKKLVARLEEKTSDQVEIFKTNMNKVRKDILGRLNLLEEIISALISKSLITELMKPQAAYNHESVRDIIEDVTQSSVMRLDPVSMNKLWDLITMVFKWQVQMTEDLIALTQRHLYEIENYVTNTEIQLQLQKVQTLIDNFNKILDKKEKLDLLDSTVFWLKDYNVRVSLLLRMGLQGMDGGFIINDLDPIAEEMLRNLGENIYAVTQNGRILENRSPAKKETNINELQLFVDEMIGERKLSSSSTDGHFKLSIQEENAANNNSDITENFDKIDVNLNDNNLQNLMDDLSVNEEKEEKSFQDDLLDMIGKQDD